LNFANPACIAFVAELPGLAISRIFLQLLLALLGEFRGLRLLRLLSLDSRKSREV